MKTEEISDPSACEDTRRRHDCIEQCLAAVGQTWAADYMREISTTGRRLEGAWPGRLAEARVLASRGLILQLTARGMPGPNPDELTRASVIVNDHARQRWGHGCKAERMARQAARAGSSR